MVALFLQVLLDLLLLVHWDVVLLWVDQGALCDCWYLDTCQLANKSLLLGILLLNSSDLSLKLQVLFDQVLLLLVELFSSREHSLPVGFPYGLILNVVFLIILEHRMCRLSSMLQKGPGHLIVPVLDLFHRLVEDFCVHFAEPYPFLDGLQVSLLIF